MASPVYAVYYPEAGGLIYSGVLGSGRDGTATLVQEPTTGRSLVRKTVLPTMSMAEAAWHPEVRHYRQHANIPKLIAANADRTLSHSHPSNVVVSKYCNGGNVNRYCSSEWRRKGLIYPEILIWRMLSHILSALHHLHSSEPTIIHNDIHRANVFLDWASSLPSFFLGDFGRAYNTHDYGIPSYYYKSNSRTEMPPLLREGMAKDIARLALIARSLMTEPDPSASINREYIHSQYDRNPPGSKYSFDTCSLLPGPTDLLTKEARHRAAVSMAPEPYYSRALHLMLQSMVHLGGRDRKARPLYFYCWDDYEKFVTSLQVQINMRLDQVESEHIPAAWQQVPEIPSPFLFNSGIELFRYFQQNDCPPGTWRVAKLERSCEALKLLYVSEELYTGIDGELRELKLVEDDGQQEREPAR